MPDRGDGDNFPRWEDPPAESSVRDRGGRNEDGSRSTTRRRYEREDRVTPAASSSGERDVSTTRSTHEERDASERSSSRRYERGAERSRNRGGGRQQSGSGTGLYGSDVGSNMLRAGVAEAVGTFILVFTGTSVAVAASLDLAIVGAAYD